MKKILWKIGGEAGFGILTSGLTFSKIASRSGYQVFDYVAYPSLIRGGHNVYETNFSQGKVFSSKQEIDYLVCLNKQTYELHKSDLKADSYVLYDPEDFEPEGRGIKIPIAFKKELRELKGELIMRNTIALGASLALMGADLTILFDILQSQFVGKGKDVVSFNQKLAQLGYDHITKNFSQHILPVMEKRSLAQRQLVLSGNDAFSLGSVIADCRLYAAYPMTPSSTVLTTLAGWQVKSKMVVRHGEDEISVINTAIGSSFAGVRSSVGTSGGGFALMVETISLSGVTEIPLVIFLSQRPGPATGMPTWTEQGDLLFAVHAGHGEFPKIILAPGDVSEMLSLTTRAFDLADIYQLPVIIMSDMALSETHESIEEKEVMELIRSYKIRRGKIVEKPASKKYLRYALSEDGISDMLIPGAKEHFYQANSYEHEEDGHTTEASDVRIAQVEKRNKKWETYLKKDFAGPTAYGNISQADIVFVSWGSTKGPLLSAIELMKEQGKKAALLHFTHVFPLYKEEIALHFIGNKRYILVENNSHGQFGKLLRQETGIEIKEQILKYDGRPFMAEEIVKQVSGI